MPTAILSWLLSLLSGPLVDKVLGHLEAQAANQTERDKVRTQATVESLKLAAGDLANQRSAANQIRLATAGYIEMRVLTTAIALPFIAHLWLVGLDTMFGFGWKVAAFPGVFAEWEGAILLSFFGVVTVGNGIRAFAGAIAARK